MVRPPSHPPVRGPVVVAAGQGGGQEPAAVQRAVVEATSPAVAVASPAPLPALAIPIANQPTIVRRFTGDPSTSATELDPMPSASGTATDLPPSGAAERDSTTALLDRVDEMMARLEERILEELERRGGRFAGLF
jgi:hypothetical protein